MKRWFKELRETHWINVWFSTRRAALEWSVQCQLLKCEDAGIKDDFQAGYAEALCHSWLAAGYPETPAVEALRQAVRDRIVVAPSNQENAA